MVRKTIDKEEKKETPKDLIDELKVGLEKIDAGDAVKIRELSPEDIDYEELCIQLKAATGEITRLEEENEKRSNECASLSVTIISLQKQLDQECDSNAELEDKLADNKELLDTLKDKLDDKSIPSKSYYEDQIQILEEKLAMCDKAYKDKEIFLQKIRNLITST